MKTPKIKSKTFPWIRTPEGEFKIILEVRPDLTAKNNVTKEGLLAQICPELFSKLFLVVMFRNLSVSERTLKSLYQERELVESGWNFEQSGMVEYEIISNGLKFRDVMVSCEDKNSVEWLECSSTRLERLIRQKISKFLRGDRFKNWLDRNVDNISYFVDCVFWDLDDVEADFYEYVEKFSDNFAMSLNSILTKLR